MALEAHPAGGDMPDPETVAGPGAQLKAAREAAGLSLDQVAQQLKLAPRQVRALEEEDFGVLPGRTFTRGFLRNYARLLNLDSDLLVEHLPDAAHAPSLEPPPLHSTGTTIAELPTAHAHAPSFGRWMIPLVLVACIVAAAGYEWYRGRPAGPPTSHATESVPVPGRPNTSTTSLPNPVKPEVAAQATLPPPASGGAVPPPAAAPTEPVPEQASPPATQAATTAPVEAILLIRYEGPSWTEIRDQRGQVLISRLVDADSIEPFDGTPPFSIVLGNARAVTLIYRGQPVDLAPYTRLNVARLVLR
jgi:cytoskeleton protein RodZ